MILRVSVLSAALGLLTTLAMTAPEEGPHSDDAFWTTPFVGSYGCLHCDVCSDDGHITWDGTIHGTYASWPDGIHSCQGANSCADHGVCGPEDDDADGAADADREEQQRSADLAATLEAVRLSVLRQDANSLRELVDVHREVVLHSHRGAIQVVGCGDQVVAHFPVRPDLFRALSQ